MLQFIPGGSISFGNISFATDFYPCLSVYKKNIKYWPTLEVSEMHLYYGHICVASKINSRVHLNSFTV